MEKKRSRDQGPCYRFGPDAYDRSREKLDEGLPVNDEDLQRYLQTIYN